MTSRMLALVPKRPLESSEDPAWQKIWLAAQRSDWRSLAVVAAGKGRSTVGVAQMLIQVGWRHRRMPMGLADLRQVPLSHLEGAIAQVQAHVDGGERVLIALGSIFDNPTTVPLARAADRAILCVTLGITAIDGAEQTVEEIGKDRFLGALILHPEGGGKPAGPSDG
jgi:hypothetical protein